LAKVATINCDASLDDEGDDDTTQLTLQSTAGLFIVHGIFTGVAILVVIFTNAREQHPWRKWGNNAEHHSLDTGEVTKSINRVSDGESSDVLARYEKMVENQHEKMAAILVMINEMQNESDEMRLLLKSNAELPSQSASSAEKRDA
jgi:hypothetical protein